MFAAATYTTRRAELCRLVGDGLILLPGHGESPMNFADNCYRFRQDSSFLYYAGLDQPDLVLLVDADSGEAVLYGDELDIDHIVWMGDLPTVAARAARAGIGRTAPRADLPGILAAAGRAGRRVHTLPTYRAAQVLALDGWLGGIPKPSLDLIRAVVAQRSVKSDEELAEMDRAASLSVDMHVAAMRMVRPGLREWEIAAEVERVAAAAGGRLAFSVIATVRGQVLHNHDHTGVLRSGDLFLLDAGAETALGYAGDLSSTFPVDPGFTDRQAAVYDLCLAAHRAAVDRIGPGVPNREVHFAAARAIAAGLKDLGLMRGDPDEAVAGGAHALFFPCGVGHMLGLDVHDMESLGEVWVGYDGEPKSTEFGLKSLRLARPLQPGFTLTIEPGIYFIPQLIDLWRGEGRFADFIAYDAVDAWRDFGGVRNEENYVVTADGKRLLGKPKPMTRDEVAAARAAG